MSGEDEDNNGVEHVPEEEDKDKLKQRKENNIPQGLFNSEEPAKKRSKLVLSEPQISDMKMGVIRVVPIEPIKVMEIDDSDDEDDAIKGGDDNDEVAMEDNDEVELDIQVLRDNYERDQKLRKEEMTRVYENKIQNLQSELDESRRSGAAYSHEIQELTTKNMSLESRNSELESSASALLKRLNDVLEETEAERRAFTEIDACISVHIKAVDPKAETQLMEETGVMDSQVNPEAEAQITELDRVREEKSLMNFEPVNVDENSNSNVCTLQTVGDLRVRMAIMQSLHS